MTKLSGKGLVWLITWPLAFTGFSCVLIPSASAGMKIDGLTISSDFRYRYEIDRANDKTEDRDRSRIRFRLGFKYAWSDRVEFGARLRTGSNDPQSPHQTLGQFDTGETDTSEEGFLTNKVTGNQLFGLDRAYIKAKWGAGGFGWLGKNQVALWQQYETYWDSDFQPEGAAVGYTMKLGNQGKLTLQGGYYYLTDNSFSGVGEDDAIVPLQALYERGVGPVALTLAVAGAPAIEEDVKLPGRERTYYLYSVQAKLKTLPIPVAVGYEIYHGTRETLGHMVMLRIKPLKKVKVQWHYFYIPVNSVPLQGLIAQDDFRFSSNFRGHRFLVGYQIAKGLNIDFRVYPQDTLRENLSTADVPAFGRGTYVQSAADTTRFQTNLNIKF